MRKSSARPRQFLNRRGALFCGVVVVSMVLFLMPPHISYRTIRQSEMRMYHPSKFTEMVVLSNRHPFPDSPSILEESHELKCVSVSNRTEGICLLYSGFGSGEPFHNVKKNDLLIFQFDKDDNLVGVVDKGGKTIGFAPSLLSDDNRSSPRTPSASPAEPKPHAESAEGAEDESHAESAEGAEDESHAESAEDAEDESHAESAEGAEP